MFLTVSFSLRDFWTHWLFTRLLLLLQSFVEWGNEMLRTSFCIANERRCSRYSIWCTCFWMVLRMRWEAFLWGDRLNIHWCWHGWINWKIPPAIVLLTVGIPKCSDIHPSTCSGYHFYATSTEEEFWYKTDRRTSGNSAEAKACIHFSTWYSRATLNDLYLNACKRYSAQTMKTEINICFSTEATRIEIIRPHKSLALYFYPCQIQLGEGFESWKVFDVWQLFSTFYILQCTQWNKCKIHFQWKKKIDECVPMSLPLPYSLRMMRS